MGGHNHRIGGRHRHLFVLQLDVGPTVAKFLDKEGMAHRHGAVKASTAILRQGVGVQ